MEIISIYSKLPKIQIIGFLLILLIIILISKSFPVSISDSLLNLNFFINRQG